MLWHYVFRSIEWQVYVTARKTKRQGLVLSVFSEIFKLLCDAMVIFSPKGAAGRAAP